MGVPPAGDAGPSDVLEVGPGAPRGGRGVTDARALRRRDRLLRAAADAGMFVRVVEDACAGATPQAHRSALTVLRGYAPQIEVTTVSEELERLAAASLA